MKILTGMVAVLAVIVAQPAAAGQWRGLGGGRMDVQVQQRPNGVRQQPQRQPQRDFQRSDRPPDRRPDGRMSDEERRDLHRDLDRASREIYKGRR